MRRVFALFVLLGSAVPAAQAEPIFARTYRDRYGYQPSCTACHREGGGSPLNAFGEELKQRKVTPASWAAVEPLDSDRDGASNLDEIKARSNPGDPASTPKSPGAWLEPENLIPKEVQAVFPGVRTYKPVDTLLTEKEVERARALGVTLGAKDENTIFLPLEGNQPLGAAIIVPAVFQGKTFFVLVAVDRTLVVTKVSPMSPTDVPAAASATIYASFAGVHVKDLPLGEASTLDGSLQAAVKRAGTLLYVRLKKE